MFMLRRWGAQERRFKLRVPCSQPVAFLHLPLPGPCGITGGNMGLGESFCSNGSPAFTFRDLLLSATCGQVTELLRASVSSFVKQK